MLFRSNDLRLHRHPARRMRFVISHSGRVAAQEDLAVEETVARRA